MVWATVEQTTSWTGRTVDEAGLARAHHIIELAAGVTEDAADAPAAGTTALVWLGRAVGYQAGFMSLHPDLFGSLEMQSELTEGHQIRVRDQDWFVALLAPLAKVALTRAGYPPPTTDEAAADPVPHPSGGFPDPPTQFGDWTEDHLPRVHPRTLVLSDGTEVDLP